MDAADKNKHWEKADKKSKEFLEKKRKEGEGRLKKEGKETQKKEVVKMESKMGKAVVMQLLMELLKEVIGKLVKWFKSANKKIDTFLDSIGEAIHSFVSKLKKHLINAGNTAITTLATAIFGPIVRAVTRIWIMIKQGWRSLKEAVAFLKDPANKNMPLNIKLLQVGKIVIAGLSGIGALVLGQVIETGLTAAFPVLATPIPLLGNLASIIGLFMGGLIAGIIGAIVLNLIDKQLAKKLKEETDKRIVNTNNKILATQDKQIAVATVKLEQTKRTAANQIMESFTKYGNKIETSLSENENSRNKTDEMLDDMEKMLNNL